MEYTNKDMLLLELIGKPVLCVKDGIITDMNRAAAQMQIPQNTPICQLLAENSDAYETFISGQLSITLIVAGISCNATVMRTEEMDLFILDQPEDFAKLQSIALAAQQLRVPLNDVMTLTDQLLASNDLEAECRLRTQAQKINKGLFQLLRIITNMADAQRYTGPEVPRMELINLTAFIGDIFEKARVLTSDTGIRLKYTGPQQPILGLAAGEYLERGIYNMISNAIKFSPKNSTVEADLTLNGNMLSLRVHDQGQGIPARIYSNLFSRYTRQPGIEDGRHGIGIGMTFVRAAASVHGGTILIDQPETGGTRVTMTIAVRKTDSDTVRSPILPLHDYVGGWDHTLVELSDNLPIEAYDQS